MRTNTTPTASEALGALSRYTRNLPQQRLQTTQHSRRFYRILSRNFAKLPATQITPDFIKELENNLGNLPLRMRHRLAQQLYRTNLELLKDHPVAYFENAALIREQLRSSIPSNAAYKRLRDEGIIL